MWSHPAPKWILCEFDVSRIRPQTLTWQNLTSAERVTRCGRPRYPPWGVTHLSSKSDQIKMREHMDRRVTPPKWVTIPAWGSLPPCKQALKVSLSPFLQFQQLNHSPFIIWVNLVPLESHFYDLISCYYFWRWVLQCQMYRLHYKLCCFLKVGLTCLFFSFMRSDSFLFVFAL